MTKSVLLAVFLVAAGACGKASESDSRDPARSAYDKDADNTQRNVRDRNGATQTPVDQKDNEADRTRTQEIRKRIMDAKLSVDAQNVKVITANGRVTLRGPVKAKSEKETIGRIATEVAGAGNVDDQIEVEAAR